MINTVTAKYWEQSKENKDGKAQGNIKCLLCPNYCIIGNNESGKCKARVNENGTLTAYSYGVISSIALDPIEKKPLYEYYPGSMILSAGSYGCNLHCPFCQNFAISTRFDTGSAHKEVISPDDLNALAKSNTCVAQGNIGIAFTYNEPLIGYEFVKDTVILNRNDGLKNVLVTNGYINEEPLCELLQYIDAMNIDVKGWGERTYKTIGGTRDSILTAIKLAHKTCHIELTTLVIPGENEDDIEEIAKWIASVDKNIPYHLSRFFPRYKYSGRSPTPAQTMYKLKDIAEKYLSKVYLGNI